MWFIFSSTWIISILYPCAMPVDLDSDSPRFNLMSRQVSRPADALPLYTDGRNYSRFPYSKWNVNRASWLGLAAATRCVETFPTRIFAIIV